MCAIRFTPGVFLLALVYPGSFQNQPGCGIPGRPFQGDYWPQKKEYKFKETIQYNCPEGFLKGDETRSCYSSGQWSGSVPVCLRKLQGTADINITVEPKECVEISSDGIKTPWTPADLIGKCTHSYKCKDLRLLIGLKNGSCTLDGLKLTFLKPVYPKFTAFSEHDGNTRTLCNLSAPVDDVLGSAVQIDCYSRKPSTGILLDFHMDKDKFLSLCGVTLFSHLITFGCELPDAPLNGYMQQKKNKSFEFLCFPHFELKGKRSIDCYPDGTWSERSPTCVRSNVERRINGTTEDPRCPKDSLCISFVFVGLAGAVVVIFISILVVIVYTRKRKRKEKAGKRVRCSSQSSNSLVISYHHNRNSTDYYSNPDFLQAEDGGRPRSDVPDILENRALNKVKPQTNRGAIPSAHIYADPVYSEMEDERGQSGVMVDNVLYN